ncbi:MAG: DUF2283 domain-containing protein [Planctomycetota bacterium]|jgi:uncharacterized protein YuzE
MDKVKVHYDAEGRTLTVWVADPRDEAVCEEADDDTVLIKDASGRIIGFEKLNVSLEAEANGVTVEVLSSPTHGGDA